LCAAFNKADRIVVKQLYNRTLASFTEFPKTIAKTDQLSALVDADVYILAVSDRAIKQLAAALPFKNKLVVHTAGGNSLNALASKNRKGVFYPLQTFSKDKPIEFTDIPICIEASDASDFSLLSTLGNQISREVHLVNSSQRKALHTAAVYSCNFVNHMYAISQDICTEANVSFDLLKPLIKETASKINTLPPKAAQTGPAMRNDKKTMRKHLKKLSSKLYHDIYLLISKSIKKTYEL
jgi:predicted short-subunit dehydrogenase-like oxidoreductase (DUF2520 family)